MPKTRTCLMMLVKQLLRDLGSWTVGADCVEWQSEQAEKRQQFAHPVRETRYAILLQAKHLLDQFHCFGVDLRGAGDSPMCVAEKAVHSAIEDKHIFLEEWLEASAEIPTMEGFAEDIVAVAEHFSWRDFYLFGHSSGGCGVMAAIPKLGGRVRAAFIYEPVTIDPVKLRQKGVVAPATERLCKKALKRRHQFPSKDAAYATYSTRAFKHFDKNMLRAYVEHGFKPIPGGTGVELKCSRTCEALVFALMERMSAECFDALAGIKCPVFVGAGEGTYGGKEMANRSDIVARQLGNGRLERMSHSHFAPFEDPKDYAERLARCLLSPSRQSRL